MASEPECEHSSAENQRATQTLTMTPAEKHEEEQLQLYNSANKTGKRDPDFDPRSWDDMVKGLSVEDVHARQNHERLMKAKQESLLMVETETLRASLNSHEQMASTTVLEPVEGQSHWECAGCTFHNHPLVSNCEICDAPRPTHSAPTSGDDIASSTSRSFLQ